MSGHGDIVPHVQGFTGLIRVPSLFITGVNKQLHLLALQPKMSKFLM